MSEAENLFAVDAGGVVYIGAGERVPLKGIVADGFRVVHLYTKAWLRCGYLAELKGIVEDAEYRYSVEERVIGKRRR